MPHEETQRAPARWHSLSLEGREKLSITGVDDVSGFDEELVVLRTGQGELTVRGRQLHIVVENPEHHEGGVRQLFVNGEEVAPAVLMDDMLTEKTEIRVVM